SVIQGDTKRSAHFGQVYLPFDRCIRHTDIVKFLPKIELFDSKENTIFSACASIGGNDGSFRHTLCSSRPVAQSLQALAIIKIILKYGLLSCRLSGHI